MLYCPITRSSLRPGLNLIVKACDFIKDSCAKPSPGWSRPVLCRRPSRTDDLIPTQAVYSLGLELQRADDRHQASLSDFSIPGLLSSVTSRVSTRIRLSKPSANALLPRLNGRSSTGKRRPKPPTTLSNTPDAHHPFSAAFYLDVGPMVLVWAGLLDADDDLMRSSVLYFREGPDVQLYGYRSNPLARAVLIHEISSCEPCYSWNILHSWQLADRYRFLEGVYSLLAGSVSKQTYSASEHRHGVQSVQCSTYIAFYCARLSVIDDEIAEGELHLLRLCPQAWMTSEQETSFENMPTLHGPVTLRFRLSRDKQVLDVQFHPKWHQSAPKVILHAPAVRGVTYVAVNGKRYAVKKEIVL